VLISLGKESRYFGSRRSGSRRLIKSRYFGSRRSGSRWLIKSDTLDQEDQEAEG